MKMQALLLLSVTSAGLSDDATATSGSASGSGSATSGSASGSGSGSGSGSATATRDPAVVAAVNAEIQARQAWDALEYDDSYQYLMCCYPGSNVCDADGCNPPSNWCSKNAGACAACSFNEAVDTYGGVSGLATLYVCTATTESTGPSTGPGTDTDSLIVGERPAMADWPDGKSPQCCWGGCGQCVDQYAFCSSTADNCANCDNPEIEALAQLAIQPTYHMCPDMEVNETLAWAGAGKEFHCCWNDDCNSCDLDWCSKTWGQCGQCAGIMKACPIVQSSETLAPGDSIPQLTEYGKEWWCCNQGECGDQCHKPGTTDGDWCLQSTDKCAECAGDVTKCDLPPPATLEKTDVLEDNTAPDGTEWQCCLTPLSCGGCYPTNDWCAKSTANCDQCAGQFAGCPPPDRRLVHERPISSTTATTASLVLVAFTSHLVV